MKSLLINIQIDEFKLAQLEEIEEELNQLLAQFRRKRITYNVNDTIGQPLPVSENDINE